MSVQAHKTAAITASKGAGGTPTPEQLTRINGFALDELAAEAVYVRTAYLAHNAIDRDNEVFDDALLMDFARTLPGKGLFVRHPMGWDGDSGPGPGRWFEARVVEMTHDEARAALRQPDLRWPASSPTARLLEASFYVPTGAHTEALRADISAGVAGDVSIGFRAADRTPINEGDQVVARRLHAPGEALEGSLVWLGAQPGARVTKAAPRDPDTDPGDTPMDKTVEQLKAAEDAKAAAEARASQAEASIATITKALGLDLTVSANLDQVKQAMADAKGYRDAVIDEVCAAKRTLGMLGDTEEALAAAKGFYAQMPLALLISERDALAKAAEGGAGMGGSDPNTTGADGDPPAPGGDQKDVRNPFHNPLVHGKAA